MLTLAVTLCNAGLLSREAVAAAFDETAAQQQQQQCSAARRAPVAALREFFSMPVVGDRRFRIVDGGREPGEG